MADKKILHVLKSGMVLDRSIMIGRSADEIGSAIAVIRAEDHRRLRVVDNADQFFTAEKLMELIRAKDKDYLMVAENAGIDITAEHVDAIWKADAIANAIKMKMPPKYTFAEVPAGWSIADDISLGPTIVRRKRINPQGNSGTYTISPKRLETLWGLASRRWAKLAGATDNGGIVESQGVRRTATIGPNCIVIGCQTIQRYEIEQIAKHRGWAFPAA